MSKRISIIVVDDSLLIRTMFKEMLSSQEDMEVVATCADPLEAREKIKQFNPDVITLDIEMPKMDGLTFLEKIMRLRPMPVIMASSLTQKGAEATLAALEIGAFDYVSKPEVNQNRDTIGALKDDLVSKVRAAAQSNVAQRRHLQVQGDVLVVPFNPPGGISHHVIAIGASTGGVEALREIFIRMPANSPPIIITQHMPEKFTASLAARLNSISALTVSEATPHARLKQGHAYIAPGGAAHLKVMKVGGEFVCKIEEGGPVSGHRPSVDVLFKSVATAIKDHAVGVILTGMGRDGAEGMKAMRDSGAYNFGQDQGSCVVYGMPQVAHKLGGVHRELPLLDIPAAVLHYCESRRETS